MVTLITAVAQDNTTFISQDQLANRVGSVAAIVGNDTSNQQNSGRFGAAQFINQSMNLASQSNVTTPVDTIISQQIAEILSGIVAPYINNVTNNFATNEDDVSDRQVNIHFFVKNLFKFVKK
jgi:hypothetical protein